MKRPTTAGLAAITPAPMPADQIAEFVARCLVRQARRSGATTRAALRVIQGGMTAKEAAFAEGLSPSKANVVRSRVSELRRSR
jgi:hypothetical protein